MRLKLFGNSIFLLIIFSNSLISQSYLEESANQALNLYSNVISDVKNDVSKCQFYPSCSQFSKESIKEYGFLKGVVLTGDRFLRCSGGHLYKHSYPRTNNLFYDPPIKNFLFGEGNLWNFGISSYLNNEHEHKEDSIFSFPFHLFQQNNFNLSILELERISFNSNENELNDKANLLIALCHFRMQNSIEAFKYLENINQNNEELAFNVNSLKFLINDLENTNRWNANYFSDKINDTINDNQYLRYEIYSLFKLREFEEIKNILSKNNNILDSNKIYEFIELQKDLSYKSPALAGIMSAIIPGSGYVYSGKLKEGISAFSVNLLLGVGIYYLILNGNYSSAVLTSFITAPFYIGNIVGSINASHLYNNKVNQLEYLKLRKIIGLEYRFSLDYLNSIWN